MASGETNLRPLISEQLSKFGFMFYYLHGEYIYKIFINNLKQVLQKILTIFCQVCNRIMKYIRKILT